MKIYLTLCFLFITIQLFAQTDSLDYQFDIKIIYEFTHQIDSSSTNSKQRLFTQLLVGQEGSQFQTITKFQKDSTLAANPSNMTYYSYGRINPTNFLIEKKEGKVITYEPLNGTALSGNNELFYYEQSADDLNWNILQDTLTIHGFLCQKATLFWEGRVWEAWFTMEIPVADGPYKFFRLPGLIISIADSDEYFKFDLVSVQKVQQNALRFKEIRSDLKLIKSTKDKFYQARKKLRENMISMALLNGENLNDEQKQIINSSIKKDNNHIEKY